LKGAAPLEGARKKVPPAGRRISRREEVLAVIELGGQKTDLIIGKTLLEHADALEVRIPKSCRGAGTCHECIVEVLQGTELLSPRTENETFLRGDFRLACQARVLSDEDDLVVVPLVRGRPQVLVESGSAEVEPDPLTRRCEGKVCFGDEELGRHDGRLLGLAVDAGTSTVAVKLVDLEAGKVLADGACGNPQIFGGSDVTNRVRYDEEVGGNELQHAILSALNRMILDLPCDPKEIREVTVAGNPTMRDILFGLDVRSLGQRPFRSITEHERNEGKRDGTVVRDTACGLGIAAHPDARVYGLPLIACHVGADTSACISSIELWDESDPVMLIDIGTNTEVVLGNRERVWAASCPAGPAFEGAGVGYGMPGLEGAIESVRFRDGHVEYETIGEVPPVGICGSGLVDLLAELLRTDRMTPVGRLTDGRKSFEVDALGGIGISEADISALAQAKGANTAGQRLLLEYAGMLPEDLKHIYLAGGFANYINAESAIAIGLVPDVPREKIVKIGNAAVEGATRVLLNRKIRARLEAFVTGIEHVELETRPNFFDVFVEGVQFGPWK
jgi:uncharacterized 2Fe-2S/4Fe-4S cluster protein (DUF4445 family)